MRRRLEGVVLCGVLLLLFAAAQTDASQVVVATVNSAAITESDIQEEIDRMIPRSTFHGQISPERRREYRHKALDALIDAELIHQAARDAGLKPDKKKVQERLKEIRDRFPSKKEYRRALEQAGITEEGLRTRMERQVLIAMMRDRVVNEPSRLTETDLRAYYESNRQKFERPASVKLRIISASSEAKVREAQERLQSGQDFSAVAAALSEDDYRIMGGNMGYIHRGRLLPELEAAAFSLEVNSVSAPLYAEKRWFLLRVDERREARQLSFDEVREKLGRDLEKKQKAERSAQWISSLRAKAEIRIFDAETRAEGQQ